MTRTQRLALIAVSITTAMAWLDMTILSVALPTMQKSFNATRGEIQWVMTIYFLTSAVLAFAAGRLSDLFGHNRTFALGTGLFILSSLGCGLAFNIDFLIVMRSLQAIGGTFGVIGGMSYLSSSFSIEHRGRAGGAAASITSIAPIIAPFLGGVIIRFLDWHWIFFVNVVVGIFIAYPLIEIYFDKKQLDHEEKKNRIKRKKQIDYFGFVLLGTFTVIITLIANHIANWGWLSERTIGLFFISVLCLFSFVLFELKKTHPIIDLRLFKLTNYTPGCIVMFLSQCVNYYIIFFGIFIQGALGYSPFMTGVLLLPIGILLTIFSTVGGALVDRYGARIPMNIGFFLMTLGYLLTTIYISSLTYISLLPAFIGYGIGAALLTNPLRVSMLNRTPQEKFGMSTAILSGIRQIGGVIGFAVVGMIISHFEIQFSAQRLAKIIPDISKKTSELLQGILSHTPSSTQMLSQFSAEKQMQIKEIVLHAYEHSFHSALLFSTVLLFFCFIISMIFIKR